MVSANWEGSKRRGVGGKGAAIGVKRMEENEKSWPMDQYKKVGIIHSRSSF